MDKELELLQLQEDLKIIKEAYLKKIEEDKQNEEKQQAKETIEKNKEKEEIDRQRLQEQEQDKKLTKSVESLLNEVRLQNTLDETPDNFASLDKKIDKLIEYQEYTAQRSVNQDFYGGAILAILIFVVSGYAVIRFFCWVGSKLTKLVFY